MSIQNETGTDIKINFSALFNWKRFHLVKTNKATLIISERLSILLQRPTQEFFDDYSRCCPRSPIRIVGQEGKIRHTGVNMEHILIHNPQHPLLVFGC